MAYARSAFGPGNTEPTTKRPRGVRPPYKALEKLPEGEDIHSVATQTAKLPLAQTSLLGTLLRSEGDFAIIHQRPGRIRKVQKGDIVDGARVTAIEDGAILMSRGTESRRLKIPGH